MLDRPYELTGLLPGWAVLAVGALVVIYAVAFVRGGTDGARTSIIGVAIVLTLGLGGWWALDQLARRDLATERRALDARAFELTARAIVPGSALACLDAIAGEKVEEACARALFANPEATAAAVSYVAAQLSLLAAAGDAAHGDAGVRRMQAALRRAIEMDRFGIAAHVLAVRDGCTPVQCGAFAMLRDVTRLRANFAEGRFETHLARHMAGWPVGASPVASNAPPLAASSTASAGTGSKSQNDLYFPSSASIPPVNIMTAEPPPPTREAAGASEPQRRTSPSGQQARQPPSPGNLPARSAPLPLLPNPQ
jgi:hypothetical protein